MNEFPKGSVYPKKIDLPQSNQIVLAQCFQYNKSFWRNFALLKNDLLRSHKASKIKSSIVLLRALEPWSLRVFEA